MGEQVWHVVGVSILAIVPVLALVNIFNAGAAGIFSVVCSTLWLVFSAAIFWSEVKSVGIRQLGIDVLGGFVRSRILRVLPDESKQKALFYGFTLGRRDFPQLIVSAEGVNELGYNAGQASAMTGKDANDWSVWLSL